MEKNKAGVCPGCSRHCTADSVRCKRGRQYFEGLSKDKTSPDAKHKNYKWEKYVAEDSPLRTLLLTGRRVRKALRGGVPEERLLQYMSEEERTQLEKLLEKIS